MTEQQQAAMRQALEALEKSDGVLTQFRDRIDNSEAITALRQALEQQPAVSDEPVANDKWEGAEYWMPLAWELCADECGEEACTELIWEGGPIPEPWGDRWLKYEDEAKRLIALVQKHTRPQPALEQQPADEPVAWGVHDQIALNKMLETHHQPAVSDERTKDEPVGEAYLCDKCHTPFDGEWECPSCGHRSATKEPVYTRPATREEKIVNPGVYKVPVREEYLSKAYRLANELREHLSITPASVAGIVSRAEEAYEAAKQRDWVGLTDEEIEREWQFQHDEEGNPPDQHDFAYAIEAKLREKNAV